jgi:hypothetical protein
MTRLNTPSVVFGVNECCSALSSNRSVSAFTVGPYRFGHIARIGDIIRAAD